MEIDQVLVRIAADTQPLSRALDNVGREGDATLRTLEKYGDRLGTSLANAALKGKGLGDVLKAMLRDIANTALRDSVVNPVGSLLGSVLGGLFGRAGGGSVNADTPYLVGERGPELFIPHSAGRIDNSGGATGSGSSGVSVNISIDARGAEQGAEARLQAVAADIQQRTFAAVFSAMEQGGRYARISGRRA